MNVRNMGPGIAAAIALLASATAVRAEDAVVVFDHSTEDKLQQEITVDAGDRINVTVNNTCPDRFNYANFAYEKRAKTAPPTPPAPPVGGAPAPVCGNEKAREALRAAGFCALQSQLVSFVHEKKNGAYTVVVTRKDGQPAAIFGLQKAQWDETVDVIAKSNNCAIPPETQGKAKQLNTPTYLVSVESSAWALGMSGGLTVSDVVDPRFAVVNDPDSTTSPAQSIVIRDMGAEDSQKLGFAGFLHVHNENWQWKGVAFAPTFGLGIAEENSMSGFVGMSAAAFDLAYLTFGWNWSSVDRLPAGQVLGEAPISDNVLNDLPSRIDDGWFIGISFKLMSPGESFFKSKVIATPEIKEAAAE